MNCCGNLKLVTSIILSIRDVKLPDVWTAFSWYGFCKVMWCHLWLWPGPLQSSGVTQWRGNLKWIPIKHNCVHLCHRWTELDICYEYFKFSTSFPPWQSANESWAGWTSNLQYNCHFNFNCNPTFTTTLNWHVSSALPLSVSAYLVSRAAMYICVFGFVLSGCMYVKLQFYPLSRCNKW